MTTTIQPTLKQEVGEGGNAAVICYFEDGAGVAVPVGSFTSVKFWLDDLSTGATINGRSNVEIKNANNGVLESVTEDVNGVPKVRTKLTLALQPADNPIVSTAPNVRSEWHRATIRGFYNAGTGVVPVEALFKVVNLSRV